MTPYLKIKGMQVFILIWFGQMVSLIGSGLTNFALGVWVYQKTGSVTQFALISMFTSLPTILISPIAGVLVDRWPRRRVMIISDLGAGLSTGAIALLLSTGHLAIWNIYAVTAISSCFAAFQWPAYTAATTTLVLKKDLDRANGMLQLGDAGARLVSPLLAGVLLVTIQLQGVILIDFATFVFALVILVQVRFPKGIAALDKAEKTSLLKEVTYSLTYLRKRKGLMSLLIFFATTSFMVGIVQVLVTPLVLSFASPRALGSILTIGGVGMLVGSIVMSTFKGSQQRIKNIFGFMFLGGLCIMAAGLHKSVPLLALSAFLFFFGQPIINSSTLVIFQKKVASHVQGRIFALIGAIANASMPFAYVVAGPLADRIFEPLMTEGGFLAGSIGQIIGVGVGRGIGLMFIIMGMLNILVIIIAYQYPPLKFVENQLPDAIADDSTTTGETEIATGKQNRTKNKNKEGSPPMDTFHKQITLKEKTNEERSLEAKRNLICVLLTYPDRAAQVLEANPEFLDAGFIEVMERLASRMVTNGSYEAADFLQNLAVQLRLQISASTGIIKPGLVSNSQIKGLKKPNKFILFTKSRFRWTMVLVVPLGLTAIVMPFYSLMNRSNFSLQSNNPSNVTPTLPKIKSVNQPIAALGRIQTQDKIINLSGPSILQTARIAQVLVQEGEQVRRGQVIAVLDIFHQQQAELEKAKFEVKVAQAKLNQVKAGTSKQSEITAQKALIADLEAQFQGAVNTQKAKIARLQAELSNAQTEYLRFQSLYEQRAISATTHDSKRLAVEILKAQVNEAKASLQQSLLSFPNQIKEAKASLEKLREVRPVDIQVAQTELATANASVSEAQAKLELAYVRTPIDGKILKVNTFPGETIGDKGIVDLGKTQQMYVIAEVYETDISKIKIGQKAIISSRALPQEFTGKVEKIGIQVGKKNVLNNDPVLDIDSRVVEVKIRLDSEYVSQAANFINLQVDVKIKTNTDNETK